MQLGMLDMAGTRQAIYRGLDSNVSMIEDEAAFREDFSACPCKKILLCNYSFILLVSSIGVTFKRVAFMLSKGLNVILRILFLHEVNDQIKIKGKLAVGTC